MRKFHKSHHSKVSKIGALCSLIDNNQSNILCYRVCKSDYLQSVIAVSTLGKLYFTSAYILEKVTATLTYDETQVLLLVFLGLFVILDWLTICF
jgi:siroheme synthase (precorrin-2 oxidase/ferrochelatase)